MHLALTDRIICPRCGPGFGLILLAHDVRDRRVLEGDLGCPNCRDQYPIRKGFADLRPPPRGPSLSQETGERGSAPDAEETVRFGALLGVAEGPATLLIRGPASVYAWSLAELVGGIEIVALDADLADETEREGVSRMVVSPRLPFSSDTFKGVLLSGKVGWEDVEEGVRVVAAGGRLVFLDGIFEDRQRLSSLGLKVLLDEDGALVARKEGPGSLPLVTLRGL